MRHEAREARKGMIHREMVAGLFFTLLERGAGEDVVIYGI